MIGLFGDAGRSALRLRPRRAVRSGAALMVRRAAIDGRAVRRALRTRLLRGRRSLPAPAARPGIACGCARARCARITSASRPRADGADAQAAPGARQSAEARARNGPTALERQARVRVLAYYLPQFHPTPRERFLVGPRLHGMDQRGAGDGPASRATASRGCRPISASTTCGCERCRRRRRRWPRATASTGSASITTISATGRVLDAAFEAIVADPAIRFPFCICWANENWTRHWDGGERELLIAQRHDDATEDAVIADAIRYAADPRYLRVRGRPLLLVYRPMQLPDPAAFAARARAAFARAGEPGVHLVYVEGMEAVDRGLRPDAIGFDAAVEFPPHGRAVPATDTITVVKEGWAGYRYDYEETVLSFLGRASVGYPRYPRPVPRLGQHAAPGAARHQLRAAPSRRCSRPMRKRSSRRRRRSSWATSGWCSSTPGTNGPRARCWSRTRRPATAGWRRCATRAWRRTACDQAGCAPAQAADPPARAEHGARARPGADAGHAGRAPVRDGRAWASSCAATCAPASRSGWSRACSTSSAMRPAPTTEHFAADRAARDPRARRRHPHLPHQRR